MQPLSQIRSRRGDAPGGVVSRTVLLGEPGSSAIALQRLSRPPWAARPLATLQSRRASTLAAFAHAKRRQLETLRAAGVAASLCLEVEGRTRLASLLPAWESFPEAVVRRGVRRVFTLHRARPMAVRMERR